jgi:vancomycin permeability regulator SanA
MSDYVAKRHWHSHWLVRLFLLTAALVVLFVVVVSFRIVHQADLQEIHPADAIVVFGAAEYYGRPSPVYRARLDHAFDLFQKHVATLIITTGGAGEDPRGHRTISAARSRDHAHQRHA